MQELVTPPPARDLLSAWELGLPCSIPQRSVVLLGALLPELQVDDLLALSLRERDEQLLQAHRILFGPRLACVVTCPGCSADLELEIAVDDLLAQSQDVGSSEDEVELDVDGWIVRGRPLVVKDVLDAAAAADAETARELLLTRSVVQVEAPDGNEPGPAVLDALPTGVEEALLTELERRNPTGALDIEQTCPDCGHVWTTPFDLADYLWAEVDGWAQRVLREIHSLATAYGWRESDILAMSAGRRAAYLDLACHG